MKKRTWVFLCLFLVFLVGTMADKVGVETFKDCLELAKELFRVLIEFILG